MASACPKRVFVPANSCHYKYSSSQNLGKPDALRDLQTTTYYRVLTISRSSLNVVINGMIVRS